ncbi:kinesin-related protein 4 isoform X2 [Danaus plexippus]|uniref:kinesin-related protein 4 isoform X2 n=1 Tax=Danaus plexippus TaxID=13037 RepID=UPI002AB14E56|nr:kinesin-related protein 4 isoform X2 [Danaus plexippus]
MSDNIKVVVKVRPLIPREIDEKLSYQWRINNNTLYQIDLSGRDVGPSFTFDKVYDTTTKTEDVYNDVAKPIVEAATTGFNGTIFAYGQTSSGKTYTMTGTDEAPGIIPLAVFNLFDIIKSIPDRDFLVRVSYVEIYNESLIDLLNLNNKVKIQETHSGVKLCTTEKLTVSPDEVLELMEQGKANRQTGSTNMNEESSRSHSIFQITIESREHIEGEQEVGSVNVSQLNLVDLAGSERSGQTGATGLRFREGTHINKSLSVLGLVIKQLSEDQNKHVNYRDSRLTRILQNSLGGNAKTGIICAVTPAAVEETISTLQFANRAKAIKNTPAVNLVTTSATMIQSLTKQLSSLKTQLESKKHVEQDNCNLQRQIANLQRLILNGFGQNRNPDVTSSARRKLHHPRRVTISTLHPIQEDPIPNIPKFCTPSLKYNPLALHGRESIPSGSFLRPVCEERAVTPPNVRIDEVIELDSEDDDSSDIQPCSPYHSCYQSKTPPCILRKTAKQAEKNLKDIVELTEREKIYTPNIVELMEKLEDKSLIIGKLEDDIVNLNRISNEKDKEMERLKCKINEAEEKIMNITSIKESLEQTCKEHNTKLTDWEVSYETLKKKSKSREDELLSLLEEVNNKNKNKNIGKLSSKAIERELKNFMDLSRDISLVNSSLESSVLETEQCPNYSDLKAQMTLKDQTIVQLEANLHSQKLKIESLEEKNDKFKEIISDLNEKLSLLDNENSLLKTSMESLNSTISDQKSLIEAANAEIESYSHLIREQQIKVTKSDVTTKNISGSDLEAIITNEELFKTNNENMKNIVRTLKEALELRNEEKEKLKANLNDNKNLEALQTELATKKTEIDSLKNEIERLNSECTNNISIIDTLLQEKSNLINIEQQLTDKLTSIQEEKSLLEKQINEHNDDIDTLKEANNKVSLELNEKISTIKKENDSKTRDMCQKISKLEIAVRDKEEIIKRLKKEGNDTQEIIDKGKLGLKKVQDIISLLKGEINEIPEYVDSLVAAFNGLGDNLTVLEDIARDVVKEKNDVLTKLQQTEHELKLLKTKIRELDNEVDEFSDEYRNAVLEEIKEHVLKQDSVDCETSDCDKLVKKISNLLRTIKCAQKVLIQSVDCKSSELNECQTLCENISKDLESETNKNNMLSQEVNTLMSSRIATMKNILEKVTDLSTKFGIENEVSCDFDEEYETGYKYVVLTIDKIDNYITVLKSEQSKCNEVENSLGDANNKILQLNEENSKLKKGIADLEANKALLTNEIRKVQEDSKHLTKDLKDTNDLLNHLREELSTKSSEMDIIENRAKSWKNEFIDLEALMQDKINILEAENMSLKSKYSDIDMRHVPQINDDDSLACGDRECYSSKQNNYKQVNSPPSLLTICCNRIADAIDFNDEKSITSSSSCTDYNETKFDKCQCKELLADVGKLVEEKHKLNATIERLQSENDKLIREREEVQREMDLEPLDEKKAIETLDSLKNENDKLRELVDDYAKSKSKALVTTLTSPIKIPDIAEDACPKCDKYLNDIRRSNESHKNEIEDLSKRLNDLEREKDEISKKYHNLTLEIPSSDALVRKLTDLEKKYQVKVNEIDKLTATIDNANKKLSVLQEENDSLSNEVMEKIEEIDALKKEQDNLKDNIKLNEECLNKPLDLESQSKTVCENCALKDETINSLRNRILTAESHSRLDRSYSDQDSSSRYNKICTLQNELHAGKEDCIELKEEVTTIKKHLEHSNLSMSQNLDLDESIMDTHMYSFNKDYGNANENKFDASKVSEAQAVDVYFCDKTDCLNYYSEKTGAKIGSLNSEYKIIDVMKMLFEDFSIKHANEVENLVNKLRDLDEEKSDLQIRMNKLVNEQSGVMKALKEKDGYLQRFADVVSEVRKNISGINDKLKTEEAIVAFRSTVLKVVDAEFGLTSSNAFEAIINKLNGNYEKDLKRNTEEIAQLKEHIQNMVAESISVNESLQALKSQLTEKESNYDLLQRQKNKMFEISNAVTIDIIKKDKDLRDQLSHYYRKLLINNIIKEEIDSSLPIDQFLDKLFNSVLNTELAGRKLEVDVEIENLRCSLQQKDKETQLLAEELNRKALEYENNIADQISLHADLKQIYEQKVRENEINTNTISKLTDEVNLLKQNVSSKDKTIESLEKKRSEHLTEQQAKELEFIKSLQMCQKELEVLNSVNQVLLREKETSGVEMENLKKLLYEQALDIEKMTTEIEFLKRTVRESSDVIESLNLKSDTLLEENDSLKKQMQEKCTNCARLETNIRTHEKTAAIQTKIINRLQSQKAEIDKANIEKETQIEEMTQKYKSLEEECQKLNTEVQTSKEENEKLKELKHTLELKIRELQSAETKPRVSMDCVPEATRRRRQSIQDSKRIFSEDIEDHKKLEAMFKSKSKPDDLFMDVDEDSSSRSTPIRLSRGRDSLLSKHDQSDTNEEHSRPSSVAASRRRRQSAYDLQRSVQHNEQQVADNSHESSGSLDSEAAHFKRLLVLCQRELEELRERFKEVDEECDTCAMYLRERDEQCARLKREKTALENTIMELRDKMKTMNPNDSTNIKSTFKDVSVNTEEDWTNLHSVVVDRMSYDAEVEKNKRLMKTIEELRYKKQDLKNTMAKMQKALDRNTNKDSQEFEAMKVELATCKRELEELKESYKALDEECETCAEYLREREQQCQKLKEAKAALEAKLEEYQQSSIVQSVRKRRQTLHDQNRLTPQRIDVATETSDDLLIYQVEKDNSKLNFEDSKEMKRLKTIVEKLSQQKTSLEHQLASVGTQYVATGSAIVQNQQLSDVMKENQKLKKMNAKLVTICKKRGKSIDSNRENEDPIQQNVKK